MQPVLYFLASTARYTHFDLLAESLPWEWEFEVPSLVLIFGKAWHSVMLDWKLSTNDDILKPHSQGSDSSSNSEWLIWGEMYAGCVRFSAMHWQCLPKIVGESRSVCRQARRDLGEAATYGRAAAWGPDAVTCHPKTAAIQMDDMSIGS